MGPSCSDRLGPLGSRKYAPILIMIGRGRPIPTWHPSKTPSLSKKEPGQDKQPWQHLTSALPLILFSLVATRLRPI